MTAAVADTAVAAAAAAAVEAVDTHKPMGMGSRDMNTEAKPVITVVRKPLSTFPYQLLFLFSWSELWRPFVQRHGLQRLSNAALSDFTAVDPLIWAPSASTTRISGGRSTAAASGTAAILSANSGDRVYGSAVRRAGSELRTIVRWDVWVAVRRRRRL